MVEKTALNEEELQAKLKEMAPKWAADKNEKGMDFIFRVHHAPSYLEGIELVRKVAQLAEDNNHHPDILIHYKRITVRYWTHTAGGVTLADVQMAQKVDELFPG